MKSALARPLAEVVDPTGAGDTFAGGLIGFLASRPDLNEMAFRQAVVVGSACASLVVEDFSVGGTVGLSKESVLPRCQKVIDAIHCGPVGF